MLELLNPNTKRIFEIIEMLYDNSDWITLDKFSKQFNVSKRTISSDLAIIKHRWDSIEIETSRKHGIRLKDNNRYDFYDIARTIYNNSVEYKLIINIFLYPNESSQFHTDKLFISESTLNRLYIKINDFLKNRSISIVKKNNRFRLFSDSENYLRSTIASLLIELYNPENKETALYNDIDYEDVVHFFKVSNYMDTNNYVFSLYYSMLFVVNLIRENQGFKFIQTDQDTMVDERVFSKMQKMIKSLEMYTYNDIKNSLLNVISEATYVKRMRKGEQHDYKYQTLKKILSKYKIQDTDENIEDLTGTIDDSYFLYNEFIFKPSLLFIRINWFYKDFEKTNSELDTFIKKEFTLIEDQETKDTDTLIPIIIFWLCLTYPEITLEPLNKSILIVSDFGTRYEKYLLAKLRDYYETSPGITINRVDNQNNPDKTYDLILTNIKGYTSEKSKVYLINDFLNLEDLKNINAFLLSNN